MNALISERNEDVVVLEDQFFLFCFYCEKDLFYFPFECKRLINAFWCVGERYWPMILLIHSPYFQYFYLTFIVSIFFLSIERISVCLWANVPFISVFVIKLKQTNIPQRSDMCNMDKNMKQEKA